MGITLIYTVLSSFLKNLSQNSTYKIWYKFKGSISEEMWVCPVTSKGRTSASNKAEVQFICKTKKVVNRLFFLTIVLNITE